MQGACPRAQNNLCKLHKKGIIILIKMEDAQIMSFLRKELIKQLIKETKPTSARDVQEKLN